MTRILCWFGFHRFEIVKRVSRASYKLHCNRCDRFYGINYDVRAVLPWSPALDELYERITAA